MADKEFKSGILIFLLQITTRVFAFISFIVMANLIGVQAIGRFAYVLSLASLLSLFVEFGTNQALIKLIAFSDADIKSHMKVISHITILKFAQFLLGTFIIFLFEFNTITSNFSFLYMIFLYTIFEGIAQIGLTAMNAKKQFVKINVYSFFYENIRTFLLISIFYFCKSVEYISFVYIILSIFYMYFVFSKGINLQITATKFVTFFRYLNFSGLRKAYNSTYLFFLSAITYQLYFKIDIILLKKISNPTEVGIYGTAYKFFEVFLFLPAILSGIAFPIVVNFFANGNLIKLKKYLSDLQFRTSVIISIVVVSMIFFSDFLINIFFNDAFASSSRIMQILFLTAFLYCLNFIYPIAINSSGNEKRGIYIYGTGLVLNVTLNYLFIPKYGAEAAAWITFFSELAVTLMYIICLYYVKIRIVNTKAVLCILFYILISVFKIICLRDEKWYSITNVFLFIVLILVVIVTNFKIFKETIMTLRVIFIK